jgi:hypothetical protein
MLWDESADDLILGGAAGLSVNSAALVTGVLTANGGAVFNESGADVDFRVESATTANALFVQGSDGFVGIGTTSPRVKLDLRSDAVIAAPTPLANAVTSGVFAIGDSVGSVVGLQLNGSSYDTYIQSRNMGAGSAAYNLLLQPLGGNVGINSTATNARLEVVAASGEVFRADSSGGAYRVVVNQTGVNMNGLVGIGTTNPVAQFAVGAAGRRIEIDGGNVIRGFDRTASWAGIDFEASAYTFDCSTARMLDIAATGVIINEDSADADFRVESNALTNAFVIDGGNSGIGFGATPRSDLHASWTQLFVGKKGSILSERDTAGGIAQMSITDNLYMDSDTGSYAYIETDQASQYVQNAGVHTFNHAVSGSAGAAPTFIVQAQFADDEAVFNNGGANIDFRVESDTTPICCLWMLGKMLWLLVMQQLVMLFILMKTERQTMYLELLMTVIMQTVMA